MTKVVFSVEKCSSKPESKIWQYTENHALVADSEHTTLNSENWINLTSVKDFTILINQTN